MEWESDSPCRSHTYPGQGPKSHGRCSGWELEFRDCGAIPGQGLLLTVERWVEGMWGRRLWWEMPVEESQAAMEARRYCWVTRRGWTITIASLSPHASIGSWTIERLAHRTPDALNYRVEPHPGCPFKCLMCWSTENDPSQGGPFMCLMLQTTEKDPRQGSSLVPERVDPQRKTGQRGLLIFSYRRLEWVNLSIWGYLERFCLNRFFSEFVVMIFLEIR